MNYKATIKKLHEIFPDFDTDTLLKILDCYTDDTFPKIIPNATLDSHIIYTDLKPLDNIVYYRNGNEINTY